MQNEEYKPSENFKRFMTDLKSWVDNGCPDPTFEQIKAGQGFRKNDSICFQIERWTDNDLVIEQIDKDLIYLFKAQFGESWYPFNKVDLVSGDSDEYNVEIENKTHYQNSLRLKWINDTVASFEEKTDGNE